MTDGERRESGRDESKSETVPFAQGFTTTTSFQRELFFGVLSATAISAALLIADFVFSTALTIVAGALAVVLFGLLWVAIPLNRRKRAETV